MVSPRRNGFEHPMKRSVLLTLAGTAALFVLLIATDIINFASDRTDRRALILGSGCVVGLSAFGLRGLSDDDDASPIDPPDPEPAKPAAAEPHVAEATAIEATAIQAAAIEATATELVYVETELAIDPVDAELQSLIDDDQMQEINDLVNAAKNNADDGPFAANGEPGDLVPGSESVEPLARLELRLTDYADDDLQRVVKESESVIIAEMVRTGQLSSEGDLTEKDIASMVFLAFTSEEMLAELRLRKSLDQPGLEASTGSDFAPLKNIE